MPVSTEAVKIAVSCGADIPLHGARIEFDTIVLLLLGLAIFPVVAIAIALALGSADIFRDSGRQTP